MFATNFEINQDLMLDTLSFSKNMQQAGMEKNIADMLALNLKNLQINQSPFEKGGLVFPRLLQKPLSISTDFHT